MSVLSLKWSKYIPHTPLPKQLAFLLLMCEEALYGGACAGGKSFALLMAALQYVDVPGYAALLLRRTFADLSLPGALFDVSRNWLTSTDARWRDTNKTWYFPSGATLTFGYLESPRDRRRYYSTAFQFIGFDELTQFEEVDFRFLYSRLRRAKGLDVPLRMRAATNPGGEGQEWVKRRFHPEQVGGNSSGRVFIPAKLSDNPYIDREAYIQSLSHLDPITRGRFLDGDWSARDEGMMFRREWFPIANDYPRDAQQYRTWDLAATPPNSLNPDPDWTAGLKVAFAAGRYWIIDITRTRTTPRGVESMVSQLAALDGAQTIVGIELEPGAAGKVVIDHYARVVLPGIALHPLPTLNALPVRAVVAASAAEAGNITIACERNVPEFLDEISAFPEGKHDDMVAALVGATELITKLNRAPAGGWAW